MRKYITTPAQNTDSLEQITLDQVRRFADTARLPVKPVWDVVRETVDRTVEAWKTLGVKDVLSPDIRKRIDAQIEKVAGTLPAGQLR